MKSRQALYRMNYFIRTTEIASLYFVWNKMPLVNFNIESQQMHQFHCITTHLFEKFGFISAHSVFIVFFERLKREREKNQQLPASTRETTTILYEVNQHRWILKFKMYKINTSIRTIIHTYERTASESKENANTYRQMAV